MDIEITTLAEEKLKDALKEKPGDFYIRIYVSKVACSGARYGIAFDDIKEGDEVSEIKGIKFITDTEYIPVYSNGISIDYVKVPQEGFIITSLHPIEGNGCSGSCDCGGSCGGCNH